MFLKKIAEELNVSGQCRKYGLSLWQCPQFLFLVMGAIIIVSALATYFIGTRYVADPLMVALIVITLTAVLFLFATIITRSFENLAEANRMKSEFVSVVSHQLRSPLSNLKWAIEILMSGRIDKVSEKQLGYFKILKENNDRMSNLVSDLLRVSRIEQGKLILNKQRVSLDSIVKEAIKRMNIFAKASNVDISFKSGVNLPEIFIDRDQAKLMIENLLDNAIRYSKGNGKVEIKLEKKNKSLQLEVKDSGVGIPKDDQKYIFRKFFRSSNALRHKTEGSGLGLYIVKSIIEKSGGKINFKSQEEVGSTFWLTLPIVNK